MACFAVPINQYLFIWYYASLDEKKTDTACSLLVNPFFFFFNEIIDLVILFTFLSPHSWKSTLKNQHTCCDWLECCALFAKWKCGSFLLCLEDAGEPWGMRRGVSGFIWLYLTRLQTLVYSFSTTTMILLLLPHVVLIFF